MAWFVLGWRDSAIDPETGDFAVLDAESAWRLRRIGLAIESNRLAQVDGYGSFPGAAASMDLPLFDELVALLARGFSGGKVGSPGTPLDEFGLQRLSLWIGPALTFLWLAAVFGLLRARTGVSRVAASLSLVAIGAMPIVMEAGRPGTIWIELFIALVFALQLRAICAVWSSSQPLDQFTNAMFAGVLGGIGLAASPIYLAPTAGIWLALVIVATRAEAAGRADLARAALLFWIATSLGGILPSIGGPWAPATGGPVAGWTDLWGTCAILGALPFVLLLWQQGEAWSGGLMRAIKGGAVTLLVVGVVVLGLMGPDHEQSALLFAALEWDAGGPWASESREALLVGGLTVLFALLSMMWRADGGPDSVASRTRVTMLCAGGATVGIASLHPPLLLLFLVPLALVMGVSLDARGTGGRVACFSLAGLLIFSVSGVVGNLEGRPQDERLDGLAAARWLRQNSRPTGPWNSVQAVHANGILTDPQLAALIIYHGQRACASWGVRRNGDLAGRFGLDEALESNSPEELSRQVRSLGISYLVLGPNSAASFARQGAPRGLIEALRVGEAELKSDFRTIWESGQDQERTRILALD